MINIPSLKINISTNEILVGNLEMNYISIDEWRKNKKIQFVR